MSRWVPCKRRENTRGLSVLGCDGYSRGPEWQVKFRVADNTPRASYFAPRNHVSGQRGHLPGYATDPALRVNEGNRDGRIQTAWNAKSSTGCFYLSGGISADSSQSAGSRYIESLSFSTIATNSPDGEIAADLTWL